MRALSLAAGALVAVALGWAGPAGAEDPFPKTRVGFLGPADRLWEGSVVLPPCVKPRLISFFSPRRRIAGQERRGEVIAEFAGEAPVAADTLAQARSCAASAGEAATAPTLLAGGPQGFSKFRTAFAACMVQANAAQAVGSMTLWVDNHCNW